MVRALGASKPPVTIDRARVERQMRELALDHVAERISDAVYRARLTRLRTEIASLDGSPHGVSAERAVAWLRALGETWQQADVPGAKANSRTPSTNASWWPGGGSSRPA